MSLQLAKSEDSEQVSVTKVTGTQFDVCVVISVPEGVWDLLPEEVKNGEDITFYGLFFSHGINEQQTIAYKLVLQIDRHTYTHITSVHNKSSAVNHPEKYLDE